MELLTREVETVQVEDSLQKPEEHNRNGDPAERLSDLQPDHPSAVPAYDPLPQRE